MTPPLSPQAKLMYLLKIQEIIDEYGHAVQGVVGVEEGDVDFAYTVGLAAQGLPELVISGVDASNAAHLLNDIIENNLDDIRARRDFVANEYTLRLRPAPRAEANVARAMYGPGVEVLQIIWPDEQHRYPGDEGFVGRQELWTES